MQTQLFVGAITAQHSVDAAVRQYRVGALLACNLKGCELAEMDVDQPLYLYTLSAPLPSLVSTRLTMLARLVHTCQAPFVDVCHCAPCVHLIVCAAVRDDAVCNYRLHMHILAEKI